MVQHTSLFEMEALELQAIKRWHPCPNWHAVKRVLKIDDNVGEVIGQAKKIGKRKFMRPPFKPSPDEVLSAQFCVPKVLALRLNGNISEQVMSATSLALVALRFGETR